MPAFQIAFVREVPNHEERCVNTEWLSNAYIGEGFCQISYSSPRIPVRKELLCFLFADVQTSSKKLYPKLDDSRVKNAAVTALLFCSSDVVVQRRIKHSSAAGIAFA